MNRPIFALLLTGLAFASLPAWSAYKAHEHDALKLDVAIEGQQLSI